MHFYCILQNKDSKIKVKTPISGESKPLPDLRPYIESRTYGNSNLNRK